MEGERILSVLKKRSESFESISEDVKMYLSPVLCEKKQKGGALEFEKLELFSLKLFKFCIEQLQRKSERETESLVQLSTLCMDSLLVCSGSSPKAPHLSFEKILLHFAKFNLSSADVSTSLQSLEVGLRVSRVLMDRLNHVEPNKEEKSSEIINLHKLVYDILWKTALQFDQRQEVGVAKLCLNLRMVALESLISSGKFEIGAIFKSAMKVDLRYRRACATPSSGSSQQDNSDSNSKLKAKSKCIKESAAAMSDVLSTVMEFHSTLERSCHMSSIVQPSLRCRDFTAGVGYLLHYATLCLKSTPLRNEGRERLSMTLDLCAKHGEGCGEDGHVIVQAQANCLQLWNAIREEEGNNFLDQSLLFLNILTDSLDDVISSEHHHDNHEAVHWLAESLELVFSCLRRRREACRGVTEREEGGASNDVMFVPRSAFQSFKLFIHSSVSFLEVMLKILSASSLAQREFSIRQNQLVLLSLLADALVDLLCEDDIEVFRSSTSDLLTSLETTPTPHPKQELAECCIPLIKSSQQIINKAGSDVLSVSERKWVANDAHRLGQALCTCDLLAEATQVLELSCHELTTWCKTGGSPSEEVQRSRSREARLLERFMYLCSVYCQNADYLDAMATVDKVITSLPVNQIAEQETISLLVGQWVRVKRHLANESNLFSSEEGGSAGSGRSLATALRKVRGISDEVKILYLEAELNMYQSQSHDTHSCEVTVVKELLTLHSLADSQSSLLHTARLSTQLSTLCRSCHAYATCSHAPCEAPLALLDDAVALLEPLVTSLPPSHTHALTHAHQHLATAHLWKALCTLEQNIGSVGVSGVTEVSAASKDHEKKIELNLTASEQSLMMSDDIIQCLFSAVENWELMREKASTSNLPMSEICHDALSMLHSLHLTATLCLAHSQPVLALRCLDVLLTICTCHAPQLTHQLLPSYNNAVSLYNDLVLSVLGPRPHLLPKPHPLPSSADLGRKELVEIQCSQMMADLASAQMQLASSRRDDTRKSLLSMLSEPVLEQASTLTFMFVAKAKLLASEILQQRTFDLRSSDTFLHYVINGSDQSGGGDESDGALFRLTPLELAVDAVKIYQKLANHRSVKIEKENNESDVPSSIPGVEADLNRGFSEEDIEDTPTLETSNRSRGEDNDSGGSPSAEGREAESSLLVSSSVGAWDILIGLMSSLKCVSRLYLEQGIVKEAHHYAREGAMLARGLLLPGWYTEFLLLVCEIESVKGEYDMSAQHCLQAATLLECHTQCKQLLATQTAKQGQSAEVGGGATTTSDSTSCVRKIVYDTSFEDDDSFLDQMANLDIHTPPSLPQDGSTIIKGGSPSSLPAMELHPEACMCQVCTNPQSALHTARLVVQCCNVALMQIRDGLEKDSNVDLARVRLVADVLMSLRKMVSKRIEKCDKILETLNTAGGVEKRNEIGSGGKERTKSKNSSRSTGHKTKKSTKLPSISSPKSTHRSFAESADFQCVLVSIAVARSECSLILEQPKKAIEELESALSQLRQGDSGDNAIDKELGVARAWLHYQMGVACIQEVELSQPELSARLYKERVSEGDETKQLIDDTVATTTSRSKRSRTAKKTATTSSASVSTRPRRTRNSTAVKSSNYSASSREEASAEARDDLFLLALNHFLMCYQLCFPSLPAVLTREVSQWVGLLVRGRRGEGGGAEIAAHFVNTGINCTLTHQTIYCIGKKMRKCSGLGSIPASGKSTCHHIEEIEQTLSTSTTSKKNQLPLSSNRVLLRGRGLLQRGSAHPPTISYTRSLRHSSIGDCSLCTLCLAPKTHPSRQNYLFVAQMTCGGGDGDMAGGGGVAMGVVKLAPELLSEFDAILCSSGESVSLKERKEWWGARTKLDKQLKGLVAKLESDCLGGLSSLLSPARPELSSVVLVLGRHVQRLPWESLPSLQDNTTTIVVSRMPSLSFMAAHRVMLNCKDGIVTFNPGSAYYILNPHGDLKNTEKRFANFFSNERGWSGVIGSPPSNEAFSTALQEKDLYVYCGHSVGRFLASSGFHVLNCHAVALLAGCSSGRLSVSGSCDPTGIPLSYLMAGCPALVGCLWDVTDGEIDRLCHALLKYLLGNGDDDEATPLSSLVAASRRACKLQWLTGASAIVYGMPIVPKKS